MSLQSIELPDHVVEGEEKAAVWDKLWSLEAAVGDEEGVVVEEVHDKAGDFVIVRIPREHEAPAEHGPLLTEALAGRLAAACSVEVVDAA